MEKNDSIAKVEMEIENSHICVTFMIGVDICHFRTFHTSSDSHKCLPKLVVILLHGYKLAAYLLIRFRFVDLLNGQQQNEINITATTALKTR